MDVNMGSIVAPYAGQFVVVWESHGEIVGLADLYGSPTRRGSCGENVDARSGRDIPSNRVYRELIRVHYPLPNVSSLRCH